ncbi:HAD-IIB family hydrolase [Leadbettera azotonutricia]|uniref:HAD-superfamily hydrolase, subfamily IIB n=1 Tax=Leadbettera azotonutricia (strain ATCC BAA-888 / DSM 13862 / ZAS-9) TaxID=545695 RepID=F5YB36_LEAAZ|nr:HAD-IIB family hydrolase [Leadbettera azotonutricia]AEF82033.1 HAD-superfamily hydrolase, subfamily IIB [Leadbettera azotonutricia ZAS-9]
MKLISEITREEAEGIKYILMDIDDTLTREGKLLASSYAALWKLKEAGLKVIPVTGRPAGWCDLIAREWPADGVVGENGALAFWEESKTLKTEFYPDAVRNDHPVLAKIKARALAEFPDLRVAKDQFARLFDLALDFAEEEPILPLSAAERIKAIAIEEGAMAKVSSIHVNIWMGKYDKLSMAERFLSSRFGWISGSGDREVVFAGDSPNDEPMFARFPLACGVANVRRYGALIKNLPTYIASKECGDGFAEIAETILAKRK